MSLLNLLFSQKAHANFAFPTPYSATRSLDGHVNFAQFRALFFYVCTNCTNFNCFGFFIPKRFYFLCFFGSSTRRRHRKPKQQASPLRKGSGRQFPRQPIPTVSACFTRPSHFGFRRVPVARRLSPVRSRSALRTSYAAFAGASPSLPCIPPSPEPGPRPLAGTRSSGCSSSMLTRTPGAGPFLLGAHAPPHTRYRTDSVARQTEPPPFISSSIPPPLQVRPCRIQPPFAQ